jgi:hypothetical protein
VLQFEGGLQLAWSPTALRLAVFSGTRLKFVDIGKDSSTVRRPAARQATVLTPTVLRRLRRFGFSTAAFCASLSPKMYGLHFRKSASATDTVSQGRWVAAGQDDGSTLILDSLLPLVRPPLLASVVRYSLLTEHAG